MPTVSPPPLYSQITNEPLQRPPRLANLDWLRWFNSLVQQFGATASIEGAVSLSAQNGTIATTAFNLPTLQPGLYRVSYYARITQAATVSSSLSITIGWEDGGVACSATSTAVTGNTTSTVAQGSVILNADQASAITYAATRASVGATPMLFALSLSVESL